MVALIISFIVALITSIIILIRILYAKNFWKQQCKVIWCFHPTGNMIKFASQNGLVLRNFKGVTSNLLMKNPIIFITEPRAVDRKYIDIVFANSKQCKEVAEKTLRVSIVTSYKGVKSFISAGCDMQCELDPYYDVDTVRITNNAAKLLKTTISGVQKLEE